MNNKHILFFIIFIATNFVFYKNNCINIQKCIENKPLYTALIVYTALWVPNNIESYSQKHFSLLIFWISYLTLMGYSQDDASLIASFFLMPGKGILEKL